MVGERFALLKQADGSYLYGEGPFISAASRPAGESAFYINDFSLSDSKPWKIPAKMRVLDSLSFPAGELAVDWASLAPDGFAEVFNQVTAAIDRGDIKKSVPVATETGCVVAGDPRSLLHALNDAGKYFFPYAWVDGERGFCGLTPEVLFNLRKGRFNTMALAGTARAEDATVFVFDEKEICEHEYVAQTLIDRLSDLGMVTKKERNVLNLGSLVHFHTPLEVFMYGDYSVEMLVKKLHPTPALGPHPRSEASMQELIRWRDELGCPAYFGAPFGVYHEGIFHSVVTIRGLHWQGNQIQVPSGCGVIEASRLVNEWQELALKRNAVKSMFGV